MFAVFEVKKEIPVKKIRANALFIGTLLTWLMTCASVSAQSDGGRAHSSPALSHPITMSKSGLRVMTAPAATMTSARSLREMLLPYSTIPAPQSLPTFKSESVRRRDIT